MINRTILNRLTGFRTLGTLAGLALLSIFWACHINNADGQDHFDLQPDSAWAKCDSLIVILEDTTGKPIDTLFNDTLKSLSQLGNLSADKYPGGKAQVRIVGRKAGGLCVDQTRSFDDHGGPVVIDTVALVGAMPASVEIKPAILEISVGDASVEVLASIKPAFADQVFEWSVEDASIATLDFPKGANAGKVVVIPQKNGTVKIRARAKKDTTKSAVLTVNVGSVSGKTISLSPDTLKLYLGGPDSALTARVSPESSGTAIEWTSADEKIAKVNSKGMVTAIKEGSTEIKAKFGDAAAASEVVVKRDIPILTVASKTGAGVNVPILFSPKATQEFGSIIMYKWDLAGDGEWDDSLPGPFLGTSVDLPPQTAKYSKSGKATARFLVRDSEGNEAMVSVDLDIGDQPPEILSISKDTLISIKDSVPLHAKVHDLEGTVAWIGWDFENDGKFDDTLKTTDSVVDFKSGHRYPTPGDFLAVLRAVDNNGKVRLDTVKIKVILDPPVADAGKDTTVIAGTNVNFHAYGKDSLGTITKRELKVGDGPFLNLGKQDTTFKLPGDTGSVSCVIRITDDDGNTDLDTMVVTIVAPDKSNNQLAGLVPSAGALVPGFKPVTIIYSLLVAYPDSQVTLTANTFDPSATFSINGKPLANGVASDPVDVKVGTAPDVFKIVVTAQDGNQRSYSVSVTRAPSADASLSKLEPAGFTLKPAFLPAVLDYADTVAFADSSVTVKPTTNHPAAKVSINDSAVVSGAVSKALSLVVGDNIIKVLVTAQDGKSKSSYNIKLVRRAKLILSRKLANLAVTQTDSIEAPLGSTVNVSSLFAAGYYFSKWSVTEGTATLADSTADSTTLTLKSATVRALAAFPINVFTITTSAGAGGIFIPTSATANYGSDDTVTISPLAGYRVLTLLDNGTGALASGPALGAQTYTIKNVTGNHKIEATFLRVYTLSASTSGNGSVTPPPATVDSGTNYTFSFSSSVTGFFLSSLTDNGVAASVGGDPLTASSYGLTGIAANHVIAATFTQKTYQLTVTGVTVCVYEIKPCPIGARCISPCAFQMANPVNTNTITAIYGVKYNIATAAYADTTTNHPFLHWSKQGDTDSLQASMAVTLTKGDATFDGIYKYPVICRVCIINPPVIPISTAPVSSAASTASPASLPASSPGSKN